MKGLISMSILLAGIVFISSCYNHKYDKLYPATAGNTTTCDTNVTISYSLTIAPIIASNCYSPGNGCHDAAGSATSGWDYTTYSGLLTNLQSGALLNDINFTPLRGDNDMPKNGTQLSSCDIDLITHWINEGYPDN